jgi:hypothetical protein
MLVVAVVALTLYGAVFRKQQADEVVSAVTAAENSVAPFEPSTPVVIAPGSPGSPSATRRHRRSDAVVNGVILFLAGGRWDSYFHKECLPRLEQYFLRCHAQDYPVHIFHENMAMAQQAAIRALIPSAKAVDFENVAALWKTLPKGVREDTLAEWMQSGLQRKFQGRGYRIMCRFWAGIVWRLPSLQRYEYYWRLDTDSILTGPPVVDPFVTMQQRKCDYGFNRLKGENPHVAVGLWETFQDWAKSTGSTKSAWFQSVKRFATSPLTQQYWAPMYYNNFELGTMRLKRHKLYNDWFEHVDSKEPFGIFRHRWGDAPLHTLGVMAVVAAEGWHVCNFTKADVGYRHAAMRPGPILAIPCNATSSMGG